MLIRAVQVWGPGLLALVAWACAAAGAAGQDSSPRSLAPRVKRLCRQYVDAFGHQATGVVYHHRLDGPRGIGALASPREIATGTVDGRPLPYGYGSGIQDVALENGQLLFALCEAWETTRDEELAATARRIFGGMKRVATLSPVPGFVPRGPHPDGKSYYRDSSRDQHAAMAEALWRYGRSALATDEDRRFIVTELDEMAQRMEHNRWAIYVEDGSRIAHVGFSWRQATPIGAISILSFLAMTAEATDDPQWRGLYERYAEENDAFRWKTLLAPSAAGDWKPLTLYSNQFAQAVACLKRAEPDPQHRRQAGQLLERLARRALESNVFNSARWRRLDWAGKAEEPLIEERLHCLGLSLRQSATVTQLFARYDPAWRTSQPRPVAYLADKLVFGLATSAFHMALLSENESLMDEVAPQVERMVQVMLDDGQTYARGENYNRTVVLGLLLLAQQAN